MLYLLWIALISFIALEGCNAGFKLLTQSDDLLVFTGSVVVITVTGGWMWLLDTIVKKWWKKES